MHTFVASGTHGTKGRIVRMIDPESGCIAFDELREIDREAEVDGAALSGDRVIASASAERPMLSIIESVETSLRISRIHDHGAGPGSHRRLRHAPACRRGMAVTRPAAMAARHRCLAIDPLHPRFAISDAKQVTIIALAR